MSSMQNLTDMKQHILYIVNPISGTRQKGGVIQLIEELVDRSRYDFEVVQTEYAGHAAELAADAAQRRTEIVVAVGGDGTVNEVGRALVHTETALGIIPCGSGNGLARHLCIPIQPSKALAIINEGIIHKLDYGVINEHPFFCTCGVGFDAFISEKFAEAGKRGPLAYVENALKLGLQYRPQTYEIEVGNGSETYEAFLIACANASQYGNDAYIAPYASMKDGLLDVVVMEPFNAIEAPQVALQLFNGTLPENSHVKTFQTDRLRIRRNEEGVAHYDGDPFWTGEVIDVSLRKHAFNVVVNPWKEESAVHSPVTNLLQLVPDFFSEWKAMPEALLNKTGQDLKRLNKNLLGKFMKR